jgi:hypothetical protein
MNKYPVIGGSICAVVLIVLASLTNVVGYQTVQSSNQKTITSKPNEKELLFQTICDMVNNKEIQLIILKSQINKGISPVTNIPVLTKNQLKQMYFIGMILSKFISKSRMQSMIGKYQYNNQEIQKEISAVIEKNSALNGEIIQLQNSECDCEKRDTTRWSFPIICSILLIMIVFSVLLSDFLCSISADTGIIFLQDIGEFFGMIGIIISLIGFVMNCFLAQYPGE